MAKTWIKAVIYYLIAAFSFGILVDVALIHDSGYSIPVSLGNALMIIVAPVRMVLLFFTGHQALDAFNGWAEPVMGQLWGYGLLALFLFLFAVVFRHGWLNPLNWSKDDIDKPLQYRLRPKIKDVGVWAKHDATRGDKKARFIDRVHFGVFSKFPAFDVQRGITRRLNGMLVRPNGPEQPGARVFLGQIRHLHWIRKKRYLVYARPEHHVIVFGPSGVGKGATQMNPSMLFWNGETLDSPDGDGKGWPGPLITSTVKSDHVDVSLEWRLSLSDQCFIYDPLQMYPVYKDFWVGWNPLSGIKNFSDASKVAAALMDSESQQNAQMSGTDDYFQAQALMVLAPLLLSAGMAGLPFRTVFEWAMKLESEASDPNLVAENGDVDPNSTLYKSLVQLYEYADKFSDTAPLDQLQQVFSKDPREASGVWGSVRKVLQPYNDEMSVKSTDDSMMPRMFNPELFYRTPNATLYIIAPEIAGESKRMRPVFAAFITWLIEQAQGVAREDNGKLPYPVLANLDEVKNVGAIPGLAHTLSLTRSIGFFVKHAWQDEAQIISAYGQDDAKTITSNSRTWVILPGISDPRHLEALVQLLGERATRKGIMQLFNVKNNDQSGRAERAQAANAAMVKELRDNQALILADNLPPFVIETVRYFKDPVMARRFGMGDARRDRGVMPDPAVLRGVKLPGYDGARPEDERSMDPDRLPVPVAEREPEPAPKRKKRRGPVNSPVAVEVPEEEAVRKVNVDANSFFEQMRRGLSDDSDGGPGGGPGMG